ncbi:hypothetical protein BpJC7_00110 [Weizmannia acidilactici]|uniref:Teichuronic acid biosynthesis protein TuaF n=1 Tax=Weizmannia acidilactici TaxID=2607726 RepID=A0A5J4JEG5_9BACI|nr:hypothetical protein [Weizmannia acidilactici]GER67491.1 hypothetical protein BpJC4_19620 [Weizmannia acidilactici]GER68708.1 hypothetical protein BpJC7_00110 [Weizmannia acidilactici]
MDDVWKKRFLTKKAMFFIILLPVIFGIIGWASPAGNMPAHYTAEAAILLGNYQDDIMNNPDQVVLELENNAFYQKNLPDLSGEERAQLLSNLKVSKVNSSEIQLSLTGTSGAAASQLDSIVNAFLREDQKRYQERMEVVEEAIGDLQKIKADGRETAEEVKWLYKLKMEQLSMEKAVRFDPGTDAPQLEEKMFSRKERAVLGTLLGIAIACMLILLLELVKKRKHGEDF